MAEAASVTLNDNINRGIEQAIRNIGKAAKATYTDVQRLQRLLMGLNVTRVTSQVNANTRALQQNASAANTAARAQQAVGNAARAAGQNMGHAGGQMQSFGSFLLGLGSIHSLIDVANQAQELENRLRTITNSQEEYNALQEKLFALSTRTRSSIIDTTELYVNFQKVLSRVGIQEAELLRMVETISKGYQVGGKSAQEAAGATRQFVQALQSGTLRGQELNSIMEQMPIEIVEAFNKRVGGSIENMRKLATEGLYTRDVLRGGLADVASTIDRMFAKTTGTIANAFTYLNNQAIRFFMENKEGAQLLSAAIIFLGDNIGWVVPLVALFGAAWAATQIVRIAGEIRVLALAVWGLSAPLVIFVATFTAAAGAVFLLAAAIAVLTGTEDQFVKLMNGMIDTVVDLTGKGKVVLDELINGGKEGAAAFTETTGSVNTARGAIQGLTGATNELNTAMSKTGQESTETFTQIATHVNSVGNTLDQLLAKLRKVDTAWDQAGTSATAALNKMKATAKANPGFVGDPSLPSFDSIERPKGGSGTFTDITNPDYKSKAAVRPASTTRANVAANSGTTRNVTVIQNITTPDPDSFRKSRRQMASDAETAFAGV